MHPHCRATERQLLQTLLEQLVTAIKRALAETKQEPFPGPSCFSTTEQCVRELCSEARTVLGDYMGLAFWQSLEHSLCSGINTLDEYEQMAMDGKREELDLLAVLGRARVFVGLSQVYLLCPSPVDPIATARTKYQCLEHLVRGVGKEGGQGGRSGGEHVGRSYHFLCCRFVSIQIC